MAKKTPVKKTRKMDPKLISSQPWEILRVRRCFQWLDSNDEIQHPSRERIRGLIKTHNNSRVKVYAALRAAGYEYFKIS